MLLSVTTLCPLVASPASAEPIATAADTATGTAAASALGAGPAAGSTTSTTLPRTPPPASAWVVVDVGTGRVLTAHNDQVPLPPASLTKVLTALVATGWLPGNAVVPVTTDATTVYPDRVGMKLGQVWPLDMVLHSLLIFSANDSAYAIADRVGGSLAKFGPVMSAAAAQLGMVDHPVLHDPAGLDGTEGVDGGNLISARDLAIAGRALLAQRYLASIVALRDYSFTDPGGVAHDILSKNATFLGAEPGAIGVKTGFTDRAGLCLMAAATQHGRTMLVVVLHGTDPLDTARVLLNEAFATPTAVEPGSQLLPPVVEPHKPAPRATTTTATTLPPLTVAPTAPPAQPIRASAGTSPLRASGGASPARSASSTGGGTGLVWVMAAAVIALFLTTGIFIRRRRSVKGPAHRRGAQPRSP